MSLVAGVDACRGGWVAIVAEDGRFANSLLAASFDKLLDGLGEVTTIGIDIPIGLSDEGARAADVKDPEFLGGS